MTVSPTRPEEQLTGRRGMNTDLGPGGDSKEGESSTGIVAPPVRTPSTVYERNTSFDSRPHIGGMLDLNHESCQRALHENEETVACNSCPEAATMCGFDSVGNVLFIQDSGPDQDIRASALACGYMLHREVNRSVLRKILVDLTTADAVKWRHAWHLCRELTFANGITAVVDILVGADGATSRVRPLLTRAGLSIAPEDTKKPELQEVVELTLLGDPAEVCKVLLQMSKDWTPSFRKLIEHCDDNAIYQHPLYHLPLDHNGRSVEERQEAIAEERITVVYHIAVISDENLQACVSPYAPASVMKATQMAKFIVGQKERQKA
ncbi:hypothetical protein BD311DRAFT_782806 [Dichomitus squalens]|uniref:FAD-binding domain-containing protein n=1 Tax=Dichomitus squalens TaxID=114155 RepID=A0A4Q9M4A4_9APHY|nr:hypothetical protein BD311DRAFT_782806 [Dichomitus squalens]